MKKYICFCLIIFMNFLLITNVKAAGIYSVSISPSNKSVAIGTSVTVNVKISSSVNIGAVRYSINYDQSILSLSSTTAPGGSSSSIIEIDKRGTSGVQTLNYSYTFKAKKSGSSKISVIINQITDTGEDGNVSNINMNANYSSTIKVLSQSEIEATYSKNNNLNSLSIDGVELSPAFNADTTEYTVELQPNTESIIINASKADSKATVIGIGEVAVSDGLNTIKIEVTAQNGNIKTYIINATVLELDPINVNVDDTDYTIVRKTKNLNFDNQLFTLSTTTYNGEEIPSYYNEKLNLTLIALKDIDGNIKMFSLDGDKIEKFNELKTGGVCLYLKDTNDIPFGYAATMININDIDYPAYKFKDTSRFSLLYGINEENGNEGFYVYDNFENTLQRYDMDTSVAIKNRMQKFTYLTIILGTTTGLLFLTLMILLIKNTKKTPKISKKVEAKVEQLKEQIDSPDEKSEEQEIKIGKTHDLKQELEMAKENLKSKDEAKKEKPDKDIFDEMEEESELENTRELAKENASEYLNKKSKEDKKDSKKQREDK